MKYKLPRLSQSSRHSTLWAALVLSLGVGISGCSNSDTEEVKAVDRVDEAEEIANANAPEAEDLGLDEADTTEVVVADDADMDTTEADAEVVAEADPAPETEDEAVEEVVAEAEAPAEDAPVQALQASVEGKALYEKQCVACHANGLLNSPKFGDKAAWAPRIEKGLETLTMHSANGYKQMPAQAVNGVTKEEIHAAVEYMVEAAS